MRRAALALAILLAAAAAWLLFARPGAVENARTAERPQATTTPAGRLAGSPAPTPIPTVERRPGAPSAAGDLGAGTSADATPATSGVFGRVVRAGTGEGVEGARVRAWNYDDRRTAFGSEVVTDAEGRFALPSAPLDRKLALLAWSHDSCPVAHVRQAHAPAAEIRIEIGRGGIVEGVVRGADGRPAAGLVTYLLTPDEPIPPRCEGHQWYLGDDEEAFARARLPVTRTDEEGRYRFVGVGVKVPRVVAVSLSSLAEVRSAAVEVSRDGEKVVCNVDLPRLGSIRVRVLDAGGRPVTGVQIDLRGDFVWDSRESEAAPAEESDEADGSAEKRPIFDVAPGTYLVRAWPPSAPHQERTVEVEAGGTVEVAFSATPGFRLTGVVEDAEGHPLMRAGLFFTNRGGTVMAHTDQEGKFALDAPSADPGELAVSGGFDIRSRGHGYAGQVRLQGVVPGGTPVRVVMPRPARVTGRVDLGVGTRIAWHVANDDLATGGEIVVPDGGKLEFGSVPLGAPFLLVLEGQSAPTLVEVGAIEAGETKELGEIAIDEGRTRRAKVVGADGDPIEGARVRVAERWTEVGGLVVRTDATGVFVLERMPALPTHVRIDAAGYPSHEALIEDSVGSATRMIRLGRGGVLTGRVLEDGKPSVGASVSVDRGGPPRRDPDRTRVSAEIDAEGAFSMRLAPGTYRLHASDAKGTRRRPDSDVVVREGEATTVEIELP